MIKDNSRQPGAAGARIEAESSAAPAPGARLSRACSQLTAHSWPEGRRHIATCRPGRIPGQEASTTTVVASVQRPSARSVTECDSARRRSLAPPTAHTVGKSNALSAPGPTPTADEPGEPRERAQPIERRGTVGITRIHGTVGRPIGPVKSWGHAAAKGGGDGAYKNQVRALQRAR